MKRAATTTRQPGRLPDLLDHYSVRRLVEAGADCVKILLYYTPFDPPEINEIKHAWVERIGSECAAADVPFFLEFVGYEEGADEKGIEFARKKPDIVAGSMEEFSKDRYGVDVLKVEVPVNMAFVKGTRASKGESAYTREEAKEHSCAPRRGQRSRSFIFPRASATRPSTKHSNSPPKPARTSPAFCAAVPPGKKACPVYAKQGLKALEDWLSTKA